MMMMGWAGKRNAVRFRWLALAERDAPERKGAESVDRRNHTLWDFGILLSSLALMCIFAALKANNVDW